MLLEPRPHPDAPLVSWLQGSRGLARALGCRGASLLALGKHGAHGQLDEGGGAGEHGELQAAMGSGLGEQ